MRVDNWESKLNKVILDTIKKEKFNIGKNDCGTFVIQCIETLTDIKVFDKQYKNISDFKKVLKQLKRNNFLDLINQIAKENNFKRINISQVLRGDVLYYEDKKDLDGTVGVCIGKTTMFNWKDGMCLVENNKCKFAWRIN